MFVTFDHVKTFQLYRRKFTFNQIRPLGDFYHSLKPFPYQGLIKRHSSGFFLVVFQFHFSLFASSFYI